MSLFQKYYDTHTLYVKCDNATVDQIRDCFARALADYQKSIGKRVDCKYKVNLLMDKEGRSFGTAFVFVTNSEIYNMLLGKNPDGSDRIEYIDDPAWEPPAEGSITNDSGWSSSESLLDMNVPVDWADLCDEEDEVPTECPKIPIDLEPLITLPPYKLTAEQKEAKRGKIIEENDGKEDFDPEKVEVPDEAYLSLDRAMVVPVERKYMPNILKAQKVPTWITKEDLKAQFAPFASDSTTMQERMIKGRRVEETYPFVNINNDRVAFIIFDPSTRDAQFALHMMKKTTICKRKTDGTSVSATLIFGHSYCTDRDAMSTITQQPRTARRMNNQKRRD